MNNIYQKKGITRKEAIEKAHELFLMIDEENNEKKYTHAQVAKILSDDYKYSVTRKTVWDWSKKYHWESEFIKLMQSQIRQAEIEAVNDELSKFESLSVKQIYKSELTLRKSVLKLIEEMIKNDEFSEQGLLKLHKDTTDYILKLNEFATPGEANINITNNNLQPTQINVYVDEQESPLMKRIKEDEKRLLEERKGNG